MYEVGGRIVDVHPCRQIVEPMLAQMSGPEIVKSFVPGGVEYPLAIRLDGKFKTAFPEGKPKAPEPKPEEAFGEDCEEDQSTGENGRHGRERRQGHQGASAAPGLPGQRLPGRAAGPGDECEYLVGRRPAQPRGGQDLCCAWGGKGET